MKTNLDKSQILSRLKEINKLSSDTELANLLGINKSTLSNWYRRNTVDYDLVFSKCEHVDINWLLFGQGEMLREKEAPSYGQREESTSMLGERSGEYNLMYKKLLEEKVAELKEAYKEIGRLEFEVEHLKKDCEGAKHRTVTQRELKK